MNSSQVDIIEILRNLKYDFLLILDDAEDLLKTGKEILKEFLELIFEKGAKIKVILVSQIDLGSFVGGISGVSE